MASPTAIERARVRRVERADQRIAEVEWFIDQVSNHVELAFKARIRLATEFLKTKVVRNISRPVTKIVAKKRGGKEQVIRVTDRSVPGEFPKADTTQLMKTIIADVAEDSKGIDGFVGTPLDYGVILEISEDLDRSFLVRTLAEEQDKIMKILSGPIKSGSSR